MKTSSPAKSPVMISARMQLGKSLLTVSLVPFTIFGASRFLSSMMGHPTLIFNSCCGNPGGSCLLSTSEGKFPQGTADLSWPWETFGSVPYYFRSPYYEAHILRNRNPYIQDYVLGQKSWYFLRAQTFAFNEINIHKLMVLFHTKINAMEKSLFWFLSYFLISASIPLYVLNCYSKGNA